MTAVLWGRVYEPAGAANDADPGHPNTRHHTPCVVCGQPVDPDVAHYPCQPGCPHALGMATDCDCDLIVHADCCPDCTREAAG